MTNREVINKIIRYYMAKRLRDIKLGRIERINKDDETIKNLQAIRKDLEEAEKLKKEKFLLKRLECPKCHKDMEIDDSDSEYCFLSNETYALSHMTNWYVCPECKMSCTVEREYTYFNNGEELTKEPDDEMPEDYGRYNND